MTSTLPLPPDFADWTTSKQDAVYRYQRFLEESGWLISPARPIHFRGIYAGVPCGAPLVVGTATTNQRESVSCPQCTHALEALFPTVTVSA